MLIIRKEKKTCSEQGNKSALAQNGGRRIMKYLVLLGNFVSMMVIVLQPLCLTQTIPSLGSQPGQPYVTLAAGGIVRECYPGAPVIIETKAKGDNLAAIMADNAVQTIAYHTVAQATVAVTSNIPGLSRIPLIGPAGQAIMSALTQLVHNPTYTYIYGLAGPNATTVVPQGALSLRVHYSDVPGADPDQFQPVLIRVSRTNTNWRIIGAQKTKRNNFHRADRVDFIFLEDSVPAQLTRIGRGLFDVRPNSSLPAGEYAVVIRPISGKYKISPQSIMQHAGEGVLIGMAWDFSVQ